WLKAGELGQTTHSRSATNHTALVPPAGDEAVVRFGVKPVGYPGGDMFVGVVMAVLVCHVDPCRGCGHREQSTRCRECHHWPTSARRRTRVRPKARSCYRAQPHMNPIHSFR